MNEIEYLESIGIDREGTFSREGSYIITLIDSDDYGRIFSKLEKEEDLNILDDNSVITEQGSSIVYESISEPYLITLLADFDGDIYQLITTSIEE